MFIQEQYLLRSSDVSKACIIFTEFKLIQDGDTYDQVFLANARIIEYELYIFGNGQSNEVLGDAYMNNGAKRLIAIVGVYISQYCIVSGVACL